MVFGYFSFLLIFGAMNQKKFHDLQQPESEVAEAHNVWQYYTVTN